MWRTHTKHTTRAGHIFAPAASVLECRQQKQGSKIGLNSIPTAEPALSHLDLEQQHFGCQKQQQQPQWSCGRRGADWRAFAERQLAVWMWRQPASSWMDRI